jgi:hypothetical protein
MRDTGRMLALRLVLFLGALWHRYVVPISQARRLPRIVRLVLFAPAATLVLRAFAALLPQRGFFRD